jgi:glycosyltransferase involved in cell wall biosynthesis
MSVLYISYDGLMEQLGQSQVLPYLRQLAKGRKITLITYEKKQDFENVERKNQFRQVTLDSGIQWLPLRYHKSPGMLAKAYDIAVGIVFCSLQCIKEKVQIIHARGYVVSVIALVIRRIFNVHYIFDMRGFWVDQRVEMGLWREDSRIFRFAKWLEGRFLQRASVVFALSSAAVEAMKKWPAVRGHSINFEVVTTCTDLDLFQPPAGGPRFNSEKPFTVGYVGSAGQGYLFEPVLDLFLEIKRLKSDVKIKIVNRKDHVLIQEFLNAREIEASDVELLSCDYPEVPKNMGTMDIGLFFYQWEKTHVSSVPTRMGEFLACGVPCLSNVGGAGIIEILEKEGVGVVLRDFDSKSVRDAAVAAIDIATDNERRTQCIESAKRHFSLEAGVETYEKVYRDLEGSSL